MFATGIENSYPIIAGGIRVDEMEKRGHYKRWRDDLNLVHELNLNYLRCGPAIYKTFLAPGHYDWSWVDDVLSQMQGLGISAVLDLCHFGLPDWLRNFQNEEFPHYFAEYAEISYSPHKPLPCDGDALIERCIADCRRVGFLRPEDPVWAATQCDLPHAYVVYDHARPRNVATIREWLESHQILLAGRYSEWEYYNSDHAFLAGKKAADRIRQLQEEPLEAKV
jgi:hypothetical protein